MSEEPTPIPAPAPVTSTANTTPIQQKPTPSVSSHTISALPTIPTPSIPSTLPPPPSEQEPSKPVSLNTEALCLVYGNILILQDMFTVQEAI